MATRVKISLERALLKQFQFQNASKHPAKKAKNVRTVAGQAFTEEAWLNQLREEEDAKLLKRTYVEIAEKTPGKKAKKKYKKCPKIFENEKLEMQVLWKTCEKSSCSSWLCEPCLPKRYIKGKEFYCTKSCRT